MVIIIDIFLQSLREVFRGFEVFSIEQFGLHNGEEVLGHGVVQTIAIA